MDIESDLDHAVFRWGGPAAGTRRSDLAGAEPAQLPGPGRSRDDQPIRSEAGPSDCWQDQEYDRQNSGPDSLAKVSFEGILIALALKCALLRLYSYM